MSSVASSLNAPFQIPISNILNSSSPEDVLFQKTSSYQFDLERYFAGTVCRRNLKSA